MSVENKLINAVKNNELQKLSTYLASEDDADANTKDGEGWALLHYAVINENIDMVKALLKSGADPIQATNEGDTPLHIACRKGRMEIVKILLRHANLCKINYIDNKTTLHGDTPLHIAAKNGFTDIVKALLSDGAIYNIKNNDNQTPLELSKAFAVTKLLNLIEDSFEKASKGDMEIIKALKEASVDEFSAIMKARNSKNQPLIQEAMTNHYHKLTAKLLEMSVDLEFHFNNHERLNAVETTSVSKSTVEAVDPKEMLETLKFLAEHHLSSTSFHLPILRSISEPRGTDKNLRHWKTLQEGSILLGNTQNLIDWYKKYMPGKIEDENIKLVSDTLVYLQFDSDHLRFEVDEYGASVFASKGQGTVYYNMLNSDLNKDVRLFIGIVQKNLDTPVKRFLEAVTEKLKIIS